MEAIDLGAERSFGERHFGGCNLGDQRLTRRAVATADAFMRHPGGTFPDKLSDPAMLKGFYRLANNEKVKRQNLIAMHHRYTLERMRTVNGVVLVLHDTTELVFGGLDIDDLGPVGNGSEQGLLCHNSLAVDYDGHEVIGLANQVLQRRREVPRNESARQKREHPDRESRLWVKGVAGIPRRPGGAMWIHVADRGSDTFEFIDWAEREQHLYCIRGKSNRGIEVCVDGEWKEKKLHDYARTLATLSHRTVEVQGREGGKSRKAKVRVAASELRLRPPAHPNRGEHGDEPLRAWVVHVLEEKPPKGVEPLEWILLTNVEVRTGRMPKREWIGIALAGSLRNITRRKRRAAGWSRSSSRRARRWRWRWQYCRWWRRNCCACATWREARRRTGRRRPRWLTKTTYWR
jgi:hypothetical protein